MAADETGHAETAIFGYAFGNPALLAEALTMPAWRMDHPGAADNQRLEFLGDAVLGMLAAARLYAACPSADEGELTVRRTHMVSATALCAAAARTDLAARLRFNRGGKLPPPEAKCYADAIEAIVGAAWLDGGIDAAKRVFEGLGLSPDAVLGNPKGELQVRVQALTPPRHPQYALVKEGGKAHEPVFTMRVTVDGVGEATGTARTRKEAESRAAAALLATL